MTAHADLDVAIRVLAVRTREVVVPFRRPLATRIGTFEVAPFLLVDLITEGGHHGRVPAFGFHAAGPALIGATLRAMAAPLIGRRIGANELEAVSDGLTRDFLLLGAQGIARFAQSILDLALYDAMARAAAMPLWAFLGSESRSIRAYNSNGLGLVPPDSIGAEALRLAEEGQYAHVKCRGGRADPSEDVAAVEAARSALGDGVALSIDYNQSLGLSEARVRLDGLDGHGLLWFEEPVRSDDDDAAAALRATLRTPVMMGESYYGAEGAMRAHDAGAFDLLMPDVLRIGGVTGWRRTAAHAAAHAIPMSSHMAPEYSAHLLAATPTADWLEFVDWGAELVRDPVRVVDGQVRPPDRLGSGIEWDEDAVARYLHGSVELR